MGGRERGRDETHTAEEPAQVQLARLLEREEQFQLDEARLALLERTVEARDIARADRGDERREDVCGDGEAVHELVRGEVPAEDAQGDEVREDAPTGGG
jgi:hypothetical protein